MKKKPDPTICSSKQLLVNDLIDNRMDESEKKDILQWIENCQKEYRCNLCRDRIQSFSSLKFLCKELAIHDQIPSELANRIKAQIY
jgi:hypothetical protein